MRSVWRYEDGLVYCSDIVESDATTFDSVFTVDTHIVWYEVGNMKL